MKNKKFYGLSNDYMFHVVMQECEDAMHCLVAALLGIKVSDIKECRILNPIIMGDTMEEKDCVLNLNLLLNNEAKINIELQM